MQNMIVPLLAWIAAAGAFFALAAFALRRRARRWHRWQWRNLLILSLLIAIPAALLAQAIASRQIVLPPALQEMLGDFSPPADPAE